MRVEIERLLKQAERDLESARKNLKIEIYEVSSFLAQQAVEKFLKSLWIYLHKKNPLPTHTLTELGKGVAVPQRLRHNLANLTPDYTVSRYPDAANGVPYELYDEETARTKIALAEEVISWVKEEMNL